MLKVAKSSLSGAYPNIEFRNANILEPLGIPGSCDAAFSVATLHWVSDHQLAFRHIAQTLKSGGLFLADCGGKGNISAVNEVVSLLLGSLEAGNLSHFEDVAQTQLRLVAAGFEVRDVHLLHDPARFDSVEVFKSFMATVVLGPHLERMALSEREEFLSEIADRMPELTVDYVRLRIEAVKL